MRILILNWRDPVHPKSGGAEIVTFNHAKTWVKKGNAVVWFSSSFPNASKEEKLDGVDIIRRGNSITTYFFAYQYYKKTKQKFDIVIDEIHGVPYFTPLYVKEPKIAFIHEVAGDIWDYMYPFPVNNIGKIFEKVYFKVYKNIPFWTDADSTVHELKQKGISEDQCYVIPCPITNQTINYMPVKNNLPTFLFASRLVKMKGIEHVLKAFAEIASVLPNAQLFIVGSGEQSYLVELHKLVRELHLEKAVNFLGYVSEEQKLDIMKKSHILLHASVKEGWGLVVIEAASQGTPSVVYDVPGLRDVVRHDRTGVVIKDNTPQQLAQEALKLFHDKKRYQRYQKNGFDWAKSLRWEDVTTESMNMIKGQIKKR